MPEGPLEGGVTPRALWVVHPETTLSLTKVVLACGCALGAVSPSAKHWLVVPPLVPLQLQLKPPRDEDTMPATPALHSRPVGGIKVATPSDAPQAPLRTDKGVTEVLGDESVSPMALDDLTTKVYAVPLVRPVTSQEAVAKAQPGKLAVQVCPPGDAVTVYCKGLGVVEAACAQDTVTLPSPGAPMGVPVAAGTGLTTVTLTVAVALPLVAPVPVMVWVVADCEAVGVPLITPVELFNDRPAGNAGLTA